MKNIENLANRLEEARKSANVSAENAAKALGVTPQLILDWENGIGFPGLQLFADIAEIYGVTTDWLLSGELPSKEVIQVTTNLSNRFFNEEKMYTYISAFCNAKGFYQTMRCLPYAREKHKGQYRKENGGEQVPYIYHPLLMACQALAMGLYDDDLLSTCLLHDVCEDCGVNPMDLPVSDTCKKAVIALTKPDDFVKTPANYKAYYDSVRENRIASFVKILDRCQNLSGMSSCFDDTHMAKYILETENYIYPLIRYCRANYPELDNPLFLVKYHMTSVIETIKHYMKNKTEV